jgi:hypothetical protein
MNKDQDKDQKQSDAASQNDKLQQQRNPSNDDRKNLDPSEQTRHSVKGNE